MRSNRLKAIAKSPKLPVPSTSSESVTPRRPKNKDHVLWLGMTLRPLTGEQFSAFGVSREQGGLVVIRVNPNVPSSFQIKDVIQAVNKQPVRDMVGFLKQVTSLDGKPVHVSFVRGQKTRSEVINIYPALIVETAKTAARLTQLPVPKTSSFAYSQRQPPTINP